ncbi:HAD domain-containing protein [Dechloromonas hortensis]|uniref:HAD domain-containing protein n=1 Tax=Dechloromonas hortensis TaxID=337779 RepID=UPI001292A374|nr:HAD domain-containing protein [Dechloromonas hortensis]
MIIMLDFDGVLHPEPATAEQLFCSLPILHAILLARPAARLVVTSDWRLKHSAEQLSEMLFRGRPEFRDRFAGVTPEIPEYRYEYRGREREVEAWLQANGMTDWIAVDDVASNYTHGSPRVVLIDYRTGLVSQDIDRILELIPSK